MDAKRGRRMPVRLAALCLIPVLGMVSAALTRDVALADEQSNRVVAKGAFALNPRGKLYTEANIKDRLAMRDLLNELRDGGMVTGGPAKFGKKDCQAFVNQLDSFLMRQLKDENRQKQHHPHAGGQ
jgi:uncharacterized protein